MKTSLMYLPSAGSQAEIEAGLAGTKGHLYDRMLGDISEQAKLADELSYDSINFTEHHFHIEGIELSTNPVMLDLYVGMQTKRLRVGQLGIVLPAANPIRVAEDIAMLDHMTRGRANAGFARGYQRRWVDVMAQQMHGIHGALPHHHDAIDAANRLAFEESFNIIKKCWTEDMVSYRGKYWTIPPAGIPWDIEPTRKWGAGLDRNNMVTSVGVVPKPVQKPHPPLYQPFASSENSVRWCAKEGVTAILPPMRTENEEKLFRLYADVSGKPYGQGTGLLRDVVIANTDEEATEIWKRAGGFILNNWFEPFGFRKGLVDPGTGLLPTPEEAAEKSYQLVGTVDTVTRRLDRLLKRAPTENLFAFMFVSLTPHARVMHTLEQFATKVLPRVA